MGGYNLGELFGALRLDDSQFLAALEAAGGASRLLQVDLGKVDGSAKALGQQLQAAGYSTGVFQSALNSLRAQGLSTSEALSLVNTNIGALQARSAAFAAQEKAAAQATLEAKMVEIRAINAAKDAEIEAERQRVLAIMARVAAEEAGELAASKSALHLGAMASSSGIRPMARLGGSGAGVLALGAAAFGGYEVVKQAAQFEDALAKVRAVVGDVSSAMSDKMAVAALDLAAKVGISAKDIVAEFATMGKAEVDLGEQFKMLPVLAEFAVATNTDLEKSTKLVLTVMNTLKIPFTEVAKVTDQFVVANRMAIGSVDDFAKALEGRSGAAFRAAKVPLAEALAMTVMFARAGIDANIAQTALTQTVLKLTNSVQKHGDVTLNVQGQMVKWHDVVYNASGELNKLYDVFQTLDKAFVGAPTEKITNFFNAIGVAGQRDVYVKSLLGMGTALEDVTHKMENLGPERMKSFAAAMESPIRQFDRLKEEVRSTAIAMGEMLLPAVQAVIPLLTGVFELVHDGVKAFEDAAKSDGIIGYALRYNTLALAVKLANFVLETNVSLLKEAHDLAISPDKPVPTSAVHERSTGQGKSLMDSVAGFLGTSSSAQNGNLFDDPDADAKAEAKRLAALDKKYRIRQQEIQNEEDAAKDSLKIQLTLQSDQDTFDEAGIAKRRDRLIKYNNDILEITKDANKKRLDLEKGRTGEKTDLVIEGNTAKAIAATTLDNIRASAQAENELHAQQAEDAKIENRIQERQAEEDRRIGLQVANDKVHALQVELQAIYEHGVAVIELAKKRAQFEEQQGIITKAKLLSIERQAEDDEYKLQKEGIEGEIALLDKRKNRYGATDEAIQAKRAELVKQQGKLEDEHKAKKQSYDEAELLGLDSIGEAMVRLQVEQNKLNQLQNASDRTIDLTNKKIQTEALAVATKGLGGVYDDLANTASQAFGQVGRTLATLFTDPSAFTKNWKSAIHSIEQELVGTLLQALLKLAAAKILLKIGLGGANAPAIAAAQAGTLATTANTTADNINTSATELNTIAEDANTLALHELTTVLLTRGCGCGDEGGIAGFFKSIVTPFFGPLGGILGAGLGGVGGGEGGGESVHSTISYPGLADGGGVSKTGLAVVHAGEYMLSNAMLRGPSPVLAGGFGGNMSFDFSGAVFGPRITPNDVRSIMKEVLGDLRRSGARTSKGKL